MKGAAHSCCPRSQPGAASRVPSGTTGWAAATWLLGTPCSCWLGAACRRSVQPGLCAPPALSPAPCPKLPSQLAEQLARVTAAGFWVACPLFILRCCAHSCDGAGDKQCALCAPGNMAVKGCCSGAVLDGWWLQGFLVTAWHEQEGNPLLSCR